jgi:hypothetical protein
MTIANEVFEKLVSDRELRLKVALALGITERGVKESAIRKSDVFTKKAALVAISNHTGLTEEQILVTESATA